MGEHKTPDIKPQCPKCGKKSLCTCTRYPIRYYKCPSGHRFKKANLNRQNTS